MIKEISIDKIKQLRILLEESPNLVDINAINRLFRKEIKLASKNTKDFNFAVYSIYQNLRDASDAIIEVISESYKADMNEVKTKIEDLHSVDRLHSLGYIESKISDETGIPEELERIRRDHNRDYEMINEYHLKLEPLMNKAKKLEPKFMKIRDRLFFGPIILYLFQIFPIFLLIAFGYLRIVSTGILDAQNPTIGILITGVSILLFSMIYNYTSSIIKRKYTINKLLSKMIYMETIIEDVNFQKVQISNNFKNMTKLLKLSFPMLNYDYLDSLVEKI